MGSIKRVKSEKRCFGNFEVDSNVCSSCIIKVQCHNEREFRKRRKKRDRKRIDAVEGYWRPKYHEGEKIDFDVSEIR